MQQLQPYPRLQKRNGALELRQVNQPVSQSAWERARGQPTGQEQCTHGCSRRQLNIPAVASAYESKGELAATAGQRRCPVVVLPSPWKKEDSIRGLCRYYVPTRVYLDVHRGGFYFVMTLKSICIHTANCRKTERGIEDKTTQQERKVALGVCVRAWVVFISGRRPNAT